MPENLKQDLLHTISTMILIAAGHRSLYLDQLSSANDKILTNYYGRIPYPPELHILVCSYDINNRSAQASTVRPYSENFVTISISGHIPSTESHNIILYLSVTGASASSIAFEFAETEASLENATLLSTPFSS